MSPEEQVEIVFQTIGSAAQMLSMVRPEDCAKVLRSQVDRSFYVDPTLAQQVLAKKADIDRKLRLLDAAATFVKEFKKVGEEVIEEFNKQQEAELKAQGLSAKDIAKALSGLEEEQSDGT